MTDNAKPSAAASNAALARVYSLQQAYAQHITAYFDSVWWKVDPAWEWPGGFHGRWEPLSTDYLIRLLPIEETRVESLQVPF